MNIKRTLTLLLCCTWILSACSTAPAPEKGNGKYVAGKYEGSANGYGGELKVEVTLSADKIEKVEVKSHSETQGIGTIAIDKLPAEFVNKNSVDVDIVSGATATSEALIAAVKDAMKDF